MTQHVFARIAGFGLIVTPHAPFRVRHADESAAAIDVEHDSLKGRRFARVIPENGSYECKIDRVTESLSDVLEIQPGPDTDDWRIETSIFTCCWPHGYLLCSNDYPNDPGPFDLVGVHDELIYIQKPKVMPDIEEMCGPDQTIVNTGRDADSGWIELEYDHEGVSWRQRHEVVTLPGCRFVVTMQSPSQFAGEAVATAQQVAQSLAANETAS